MNKVCKHCSTPDVLTYTLKSGTIVKKSVCKECDLKKRTKIPLFFNYEFLHNLYHVENKTLEYMSIKYNISIQKVKNWLKYYDISLKEVKKTCKHCGTEDILTYTNKKGTIARKSICKECDNKKRKGVPVEFNYDFLYNEHHTLGYNIDQIAETYSITENQVKNWMEYYDVPIRLVCKVCGTGEDLVKRKISNQFGESEKESTFEICELCYKKRQSKGVANGIKKAKKTDSEERKEIKRKNRSESQEKNKESRTRKQKKTWSEKSKEELEELGSRISETKQNKTKEQKSEIIEKFKESMANRSEEEIIERRMKMGANHNAKATLLFSHLEEILTLLNINHKIEYKLVNSNKKVLRREKPINVYKISDTCQCRFLDCYIKLNNREINLEFDEEKHKKEIKNDLIREKEILTIKPNLEIYRIPEELYFDNKEQVIFDLLNIVLGNFKYVKFDYSSITKRDP
ncbi:MAG: hypothetical protein GY853_09935 [PVC group bacterium]|nr:hypothetical protein [PVC group bacterium]